MKKKVSGTPKVRIFSVQNPGFWVVRTGHAAGGFFVPKKVPGIQHGVFPPPTIGGSPRKIPWPRWLPPGISKTPLFDGTIVRKKVDPDDFLGVPKNYVVDLDENLKIFVDF